MKILCKYPSRERPVKFNSTLRQYMSLSADRSNIHYAITLDDNDPSLSAYLRIISTIKNDFPDVEITVVNGISKSKVHAINRDMEKFCDWDILVLISDDMIPQVQGWDFAIENFMWLKYRFTDGVIWYWDGDPATRKTETQKGLNTLCILGKNYFNRFGYIYHPDYVSLFCDNEFMEVADILGKQVYIDECIIKHVHWSNTPGEIADSLMKRTQSYFKRDEKLFFERKALNFNL